MNPTLVPFSLGASLILPALNDLQDRIILAHGKDSQSDAEIEMETIVPLGRGEQALRVRFDDSLPSEPEGLIQIFASETVPLDSFLEVAKAYLAYDKYVQDLIYQISTNRSCNFSTHVVLTSTFVNLTSISHLPLSPQHGRV